MKKICVIMSTYNGEKYLSEQLDSILCQKGVDVSIIVRDDGSSDDTVAILNSYRSRYSNIYVFADNNVGCKRSFYTAAEYAFKYCGEYGYFAFSDQDDVWKSDKLFSGIELIEKNESCYRVLYFCTPDIVDKNLIKTGTHWRSHHRLTVGESCVIQPAPGCSMIFTKSVLELFLKGNPGMMALHDSWIYKATALCGGKIIEDERKLFFYRQHDSNVVGQKKSFKQSILRRLKSLTAKRNHRQKLIQDLVTTYRNEITQENYSLIEPLLYYRKNFRAKVKLLFSSQFKTHRYISNFGFKLSILLNRY